MSVFEKSPSKTKSLKCLKNCWKYSSKVMLAIQYIIYWRKDTHVGHTRSRRMADSMHLLQLQRKMSQQSAFALDNELSVADGVSCPVKVYSRLQFDILLIVEWKSMGLIAWQQLTTVSACRTPDLWWVPHLYARQLSRCTRRVWDNRPSWLQLRQIFTGLKNSFTSNPATDLQ